MVMIVKNSLFTELSLDEYVDKSIVPSTVIRLASSCAPGLSEKLLMVATYPAPLHLYRIYLDLPTLSGKDPRRRAKQIAIGPQDLSYLDRRAWVDCTKPDEEFAYEQVRSTLISEPQRIVGNLRKETMKRINEAIFQSRGITKSRSFRSRSFGCGVGDARTKKIAEYQKYWL